MLGDFKRKLAGPTQGKPRRIRPTACDAAGSDTSTVARTFPIIGTPKQDPMSSMPNPTTNGTPQGQSMHLTQNVSSAATMQQALPPQAGAFMQGTAGTPD